MTDARVFIGADFDELKAGVRGARRQLDTLEDAVAPLSGAFTRLAAITGGALSVGAFVAAGRAAIEYGDNIGKAAAKSGIGAEQFQQLAHAARMSDVDMQSLSTSLRFMQVNVSEAATGSKSATGALAALGISVADLQRLRPEQQFELLADRINSLEDPAQRARAATDLFGRSGAELLPLFEQGSEGIRRAAAEARSLGQVLSETDLRKLQEADDAIKAMTGSFQGLTRQLTSAVAPALTVVADQLRQIFGGRTEVEQLKLDFDELTRKAEEFQRRTSASERPWWMGGLPSVRAADDAIASRDAAENAAKLAEVRAKLAAQGIFMDGGGSGPRSRSPHQFPAEAAPGYAADGTATQSAAMAAFLGRGAANPAGAPQGATRTVMRGGQLVEEPVGLAGQMDPLAQEMQLEAMRLFNEQKLEIENEYNQAVIDAVDMREMSLMDLVRGSEETQRMYREAGAMSFAEIVNFVVSSASAGNKRLAKIQQGIALAQAIWNTATGVTKALAAYDYVGAAKIAVMGALQIAKIKSTKYSEGGASGGGASAGAGGGGDSAGALDRIREANAGDAPARAQTQIVVQGSIFSTKETADWFISKVQEAVTDRDVTLIGPGSRNWDDLVAAGATAGAGG